MGDWSYLAYGGVQTGFYLVMWYYHNLNSLKNISVSQLVSCKNKMDSTLQTTFPSNNTYGSLNSLCKDPKCVHNSVVDYGNSIVGDISRDVSNLGLELISWMELHLLTPNDKMMESVSLMQKQKLDLDNLTAYRVLTLSTILLRIAANAFWHSIEMFQKCLKQLKNLQIKHLLIMKRFEPFLHQEVILVIRNSRNSMQQRI